MLQFLISNISKYAFFDNKILIVFENNLFLIQNNNDSNDTESPFYCEQDLYTRKITCKNENKNC